MYMRASAASALRKISAFSHSKPAISFSIFLVLQVQNYILVGLYIYRQISKCTDKTAKKHYWGGGGAACKFENFLTFCSPPPPNPEYGSTPLILNNLKKLCNGILGLQSTVRHYKTIKLNIKILLNIHNFQFLRRDPRAKFYIAILRAQRAENVEIFPSLAPPPPPSEKLIFAP